MDGSRWFESLAELVPVPPAYRTATADRRAVQELLGCEAELLSELVARGLPCSGPAGDERFDPHDVFNLALHSRSGRSVPERAFHFALRWMGDPTARMLEPRLWTYSLELRCGRSGGCGADSRWLSARPLPELYGGALHELSVDGSEAEATTAEIEVAGAPTMAVNATVETRGDRRELASQRLRELVDEFTSSGLRWVKAPAALHHRPDLLLPNGVATCVAASLHLAGCFEEEGFRARTRRGWVLGMLDLVHAWVEVEDVDGQTKVIDPIFALLSSLVRDPNPELGELCMGSPINRLLPTDRSAREPLEQHWCEGQEAEIDRRTTILPAAGATAGLAAAPT